MRGFSRNLAGGVIKGNEKGCWNIIVILFIIFMCLFIVASVTSH